MSSSSAAAVAAAAPAASVRPLQLLSLNNDCLLAILRRLPLEDLSAAAATCVRLHDLGRYTFEVNRLAAQLTVANGGPKKRRHHQKILDRYFRQFGDLLQEVRFAYAWTGNRRAVCSMAAENDTVFECISRDCRETLQ